MLLIMITQAGAGQSTDHFNELLDKIDSVRNQYHIAGVGLVITDQQHTLHEGYLGLADREHQRPVDAHTVFRIGSVSKTFLSLAILKLAEQGKLDLDEKVNAYLAADVYDNTYPASPIRLAYLLEHTAGFHDLDKREWAFKQSNWSLSQSLAFSPESRITAWQPGEYSSYSNSGAGIAGFVLEQVTGRKFEEFMRKEIFDPMAIETATYYPDKEISDRLATGYNTDGHSVIPYWHMLYRPFGAINMPVGEMAKSIRLLINFGQTDQGEQIVSKHSIQRLEKPMTTLAARHGLEYGYGLGNYSWISNGLVFHGHGGDADGYLAHYGYTRFNNKGYFLVINTFHGRALRVMRRHVEKWLTTGVTPQAPPPLYVLDRERIHSIVGQYQAVTKRFAGELFDRLDVFQKNGRIYTRLNEERKIELLPVNQYHFRRMNQPLATISIVQNAAGVTILQGDVGNFKRIRSK